MMKSLALVLMLLVAATGSFVLPPSVVAETTRSIAADDETPASDTPDVDAPADDSSTVDSPVVEPPAVDAPVARLSLGNTKTTPSLCFRPASAKLKPSSYSVSVITMGSAR